MRLINKHIRKQKDFAIIKCEDAKLYQSIAYF